MQVIPLPLNVIGVFSQKDLKPNNSTLRSFSTSFLAQFAPSAFIGAKKLQFIDLSSEVFRDKNAGGSIQWPFRLALTGTAVTGIKSSMASQQCKASICSS